MSKNPRLVVLIGRDEELKRRLFEDWRDKEYVSIRNPENDMHPYEQCKFAEELVVMTHDGTKVVVTTNSPYIIDHLVNLMAGHKHYREGLEEKFIMKDKRAFISSTLVMVIDCGDGPYGVPVENRSAKSVLKKGKIDWDTFSSVSEWMVNLYFDEIMPAPR
jgi:hypothetical protein